MVLKPERQKTQWKDEESQTHVVRQASVLCALSTDPGAAPVSERNAFELAHWSWISCWRAGALVPAVRLWPAAGWAGGGFWASDSAAAGSCPVPGAGTDCTSLMAEMIWAASAEASATTLEPTSGRTESTGCQTSGGRNTWHLMITLLFLHD